MSTATLSIPTLIHGRVLFEDAAVSSVGLLVAFHGYGQNAEDALEDVRKTPGVERWQIASVQALHRFYTRDSQKVIGSWMTRQDRELAIADNVNYVDQAIHRVIRESGGESQVPGALVFVGFSQGASMAYRAAVMGQHRAGAVVALGGDIPPELHDVPAIAWPRVLIGVGSRDEWFAPKAEADIAFLSSRGIRHDVVRFDGGHEWTDVFRAAVGRLLQEVAN